MQMKKWIRETDQANVWKGLAAGLLGGLVASWTMSQFQSLLSKMSEDGEQSGGKKEEKEPATAKAAEAISEGVFRHELSKKEKKVAGPGMHYAFGTAMGGVYGAAAELAPVVATGAGLPFGTTLWLGADEIAVPLLGLSKPPTKTPLSKHAYALASHFVYGLTTDIVRRSVRKALD
jgi:uncharacterized membrane protein YagU involved in acid resistance